VVAVLGATAQEPAKSDKPEPFLARGQCPVVQLANTFKANDFSGTWYRIGGLPNVEEKSVNCTVYDYQADATGFTVNSRGQLKDGTPVTQVVLLATKTSPTLGKFTTRIRDFDADLMVLNTDYTSYACLYSCYTYNNTHKAQFAWILSRSSTLAKDKIALCQRELQAVGIKFRSLRGTHQGSAKCGH